MTCPRKTFFPFAYALYNKELESHCWYCLQEDANLKRCLGCHTAVFCKEECQQLGWKDHRAECSAIKTSKSIPDIEVRLLGRIVLRQKDIMKGRDTKDPTFYKDRSSERTIMEIWSHTQEMKNDPYAMNKFDGIYEHLVHFYDKKFLLPREVVFELHCRDYINRHAISDRQYTKEVGKGLYLDLCSYDHSCRPNAAYTCDGFMATLRGLSNDTRLDDRSTTFYSYIELVSALPERQKFLKDTWYFECGCSRCVDNNDNLLTSVLCPFCPNASSRLCIFGDWEYKDKSTITCPVCKNSLSQEYKAEAIEIMRAIGRIVNSADLDNMTPADQLAFLVNLLTKADRYLPFVNVFRCKIVQLMIPLVNPFDYAFLLQLHIDAEECVRHCFPRNHPSLSFHLRNIGIFMQRVGKLEEAKLYLEEAVEMLKFTMDSDHILTMETITTLCEVCAALSQQSCTERSEESTFGTEAKDVNNSAALKSEEEQESVAENCTSEGEVLKKSITRDNQLDGDSQPCTDKRNSECASAMHADALTALLSEDIDDLPSLIDQ